MGIHQTDREAKGERSQWAMLEPFGQQNKVELDYDTTYKNKL